MKSSDSVLRPADPLHRDKSAAWPLALLYAGLIFYASLFPFQGWRDQGLSPWAYLQAPWPQYWTRFDLLANLIGYAPLGFLLALAMQRVGWRWSAALFATLTGAALSFAMECLQSYLPQRVASNVDLGMNAAGSLLGALVAEVLGRLGAVDRWQRLRARWFVHNSRGALVLLALWPVGLLFPAPVAFGLGQVYERLEEGLARALVDTPFLEWLPLREIELQPLLPGVELLCVALGALVPCMLGYTVIRHRGRRLLFAALALLAGVAVSALSAGLSYGPIYAWSWISQPVELGLMAAVVGAIVTLLLPARVCVLLLMLVLIAQVVLLNAAPESAYFSATLQSWEQGRFIHFNGLAQWVGWLWPYATFVYLIARLWSPDTDAPLPSGAPAPGASEAPVAPDTPGALHAPNPAHAPDLSDEWPVAAPFAPTMPPLEALPPPTATT